MDEKSTQTGNEEADGKESPRSVMFVSIDGKKTSPTHEEAKKRTAKIGVSYGKKEFSGKHLQAFLNGIADKGYMRCKITVGGYVQRHNYLRHLALKQAKGKVVSVNGEEFKKEFRNLDDLAIRELDEATKKESEAYGREAEKTWFEKNRDYIEELRARGVEVEVEFWEEALASEENVQRLNTLRAQGAQGDEKAGRVLLVLEKQKELRKIIDEVCNSKEARTGDVRKKELFKCIELAEDDVGVLHRRESDNENYTDALQTHKQFFKEKDSEFIKEEAALLPEDGCDYFYPMEFSPASRTVGKALEAIVAIAEMDMRVFSANFKASSPKAAQKVGGRRSKTKLEEGTNGEHQAQTNSSNANSNNATSNNSTSNNNNDAQKTPDKESPDSSPESSKLAMQGLFKVQQPRPPASSAQPIPGADRRIGQDNSDSSASNSAGTSPDSSVNHSAGSSPEGSLIEKMAGPSNSEENSAVGEMEKRIRQLSLCTKLASVALETAKSEPGLEAFGLGLANEILVRGGVITSAALARIAIK